jgi:SRSO17 transposase
LDRELYLPKAWAEDRQRRAEARRWGRGVRDKPELAMRIIAGALDADVPAGWVTGDEVSGQHARLRMMLEERQMPYVLAVPVNQRLIATVEDKVTDCAPMPWRHDCRDRPGRRSQPAPGPRAQQYHWAKTAVRPLEYTRSYWLLGARPGRSQRPGLIPLPRPRTHPAG